MKKSTVVAASLTLAVTMSGTASAKPPTRSHARQYAAAYRAVARKLGRRAPGRNILVDGMRHRAATDADLTRSLVILNRMLTPPPSPTPAPSVVGVATSYSGVPAPVSTAGAGGVPACASESGTNYSTGPANTNPSSGATGRYQIIPSTAAGYGCNLSTPAGQDACAAVIYQHQGAGAWVGCGG